MINRPVLVLNQNYEPLNICRVRRAVRLIHSGRAEMLENGAGFLHSATDLFSIPSVIRLGHVVKRPRPQRKLTRYEIFNRDNHTCQYCGKSNHQLTLDHVIPRFQGGVHTWENITTACVPCNRRKAGRTPEEAGMKLRVIPVRPRTRTPFFVPHNQLESNRDWQKYLPEN